MLRSRAHEKFGDEIWNTFHEQFASTFPFIEADNPVLLRVLSRAQLARLPVDAGILRPDSPCEHFIMLVEGTVRVFQQTGDDREVTLYRLEAGSVCVLSINGMLNQDCFGAFAVTETPVTALLLSRDDFFQAMQTSVTFCQYVLLHTSNHFRDLLELTQTTVFDSLDTRLICLLGRMSRTMATDTIHITHQEMARELGTSREVISRLLKGLERRGCISLARGAIQVNM